MARTVRFDRNTFRTVAVCGCLDKDLFTLNMPLPTSVSILNRIETTGLRWQRHPSLVSSVKLAQTRSTSRQDFGVSHGPE